MKKQHSIHQVQNLYSKYADLSPFINVYTCMVSTSVLYLQIGIIKQHKCCPNNDMQPKK